MDIFHSVVRRRWIFLVLPGSDEVTLLQLIVLEEIDFL